MPRSTRQRPSPQQRRPAFRHRRPLEQLEIHRDDVVCAIRREINRRRPLDDPVDHDAMAHAAWEHLLQSCRRHSHVVVDWEWMNNIIRYSVRKGVRDYAAFTHDLPITAYARYVSACHLRGIGGDYWPAGTRFAELAATFNSSGDEDEIERRRSQHRCLDPNDLAAIARWIQQSRTTPDPDLELVRGDGGFNVLGHAVVSTLRTAGGSVSPAAHALATAFADELQRALHRDIEPPVLTAVATAIGLRGGTRDRAIAVVRHLIGRSLND